MNVLDNEIQWVVKSKTEYEINNMKYKLADQICQERIKVELDSEFNRGYVQGLRFAEKILRRR